MVGTFRTVVLACAAASACSGVRDAKDEPPRQATVARASDAGADAPVDAAGEDAADAADAPRVYTELEKSLGLLYSEHTDFWRGVNWLVKHPDQARQPLREMVQETRFSLGSARAFIALGQIGDARDVELLASVLQRADSDTYRWEAGRALAEHGAAEAELALIAALGDAQPDVVGTAASALAKRKAEAARPRLEELLDHPDDGTRYRVVMALKNLGHAASAAALRKRARVERDADVRKLLKSMGY